MMDEFDDVGYPEDWEAHYGGEAPDDYYEYNPTGCRNCGIDADELEMTQWGVLKRRYAIQCPYCGRFIATGVVTWRERLRNMWVLTVDKWQSRNARSTSDGGDVDNMGEIPF